MYLCHSTVWSWYESLTQVRANKKKDAYWAGFPAKVETQSKPVADAIAAIKAQGFTSVGAIGLCWGWKVIVKSEGVSGLAAVASNHPS